MGQISLQTCDRIRELCSAAVDGELSELDDARVQAHLATCAPCAAFAATAAGTSRLVRTTPLEELQIPIVLPGRRIAVARKLQVVAAAAAVTMTVGLSAAVGTLGNAPSVRHSPTARQSVKLRFPDQELKMLERASQARTHTRLAL
jgi:predicted anti-sigma-YlaC factor YlaD